MGGAVGSETPHGMPASGGAQVWSIGYSYVQTGSMFGATTMIWGFIYNYDGLLGLVFAIHCTDDVLRGLLSAKSPRAVVSEEPLGLC